MKYPIFIFLTVFFLSFEHSFAQMENDINIFSKKRKKVALDNYYLAMNAYSDLVWYTGVIEWKADSVIKLESDPAIRKNLIHLKYNLVNELSKACFHTDPIVSALDTWALTFQLLNYFGDEKCDQLYPNHCKVFQNIFDRLELDFASNYREYIGEENKNRLINFANNHPIYNDNLHRESVVPYLSKWASDDNKGLMGGVSSMNNMVRDMTNRMEFYMEMMPKQTKWQIESSLPDLPSVDSLDEVIHEMRGLLKQSAHVLGKTEDIIDFNRDSILANVNYQRIVSLQMIRNERIAVMETIAGEREILLDAVQKEREAIEKFASGEREAAMNDMKLMSADMMSQSTGVGKELIDYIFYKVIILTIVLSIGLLIAIVLIKKL